MKAIYEAIMNDYEYFDPTDDDWRTHDTQPIHIVNPLADDAPEPEPTALQLAQEAAHCVDRGWYTEDNLVKMSAYAAVAQAEALTRIAEVLETWLEAGINPRG